VIRCDPAKNDLPNPANERQHMHDLTEARPTTETATADEVFAAGRKRGKDDERAAVITLLKTHALVCDPTTEEVLWTLCKVIEAGGHVGER
jgi:hypothetical protein